MKSILIVVPITKPKLVQRCRFIVVLMVLLALIGAAGCNDSPDKSNDQSSSQKQNGVAKNDDSEKPKTVVVNEGMSKKEEKKLNERLDELEKKVEEQDKAGSEKTTPQPTSQPEPTQQQVEDQVLAAAEAYYQQVEARNWDYTYDHLDSETQSAYTRNEWFAKNDWLADNGSASYTIQSVQMDGSSQGTFAHVAVLLTFADGSTSTRDTYFVYEDGAWKHRFSAEEYALLASAQAGTASPSASASPSAPASASPNPSPNPSPSRDYDAPNPDAPGNPSHMSREDCISKGGNPVPPGTDGDGDDDGCAGE